MRATFTVVAADGSGTYEETHEVTAVVVEPVDPDNRTQAERNAQNALDAARLARVEAHLGQLCAALAGLPSTSKVLVEPVLAKLNEALEAPAA